MEVKTLALTFNRKSQFTIGSYLEINITAKNRQPILNNSRQKFKLIGGYLINLLLIVSEPAPELSRPFIKRNSISSLF